MLVMTGRVTMLGLFGGLAQKAVINVQRSTVIPWATLLGVLRHTVYRSEDVPARGYEVVVTKAGKITMVWIGLASCMASRCGWPTWRCECQARRCPYASSKCAQRRGESAARQSGSKNPSTVCTASAWAPRAARTHQSDGTTRRLRTGGDALH